MNPAIPGQHIPQRSHSVLNICKLACLLVQTGLFAFFWLRVQQQYSFFAVTSLVLYGIYAVILYCLHRVYGSLRIGKERLFNLCTGQLLTLLFCDGFIYLIAALTLHCLPRIPFLALVYVLQVLFSVGWCYCTNKLYYRITPPEAAVILYNTEKELSLMETICGEYHHYDVFRRICLDDLTDEAEDLISDLPETVQAVFLGKTALPLQETVLRRCARKGITVFIRPTFGDILLSTSHRRFMSHTPMLKVTLQAPPMYYSTVKRVMDILISLLLLLLTAPVCLLTALLIRCEDGGPVLYRQQRLTKDGKIFEILKFRSMRTDAEADGVARLAAEGDTRITRVGEILRAARLDELPQLINVLRGDMSLVGPRPERPEIAELYAQKLPEFHTRLSVKAGLTGYAQVHGKYNSTPAEKLQMDLMYISGISFSMDVKLILQTIHTMLKRESTEGIPPNTKDPAA